LQQPSASRSQRSPRRFLPEPHGFQTRVDEARALGAMRAKSAPKYSTEKQQCTAANAARVRACRSRPPNL
jgi:hypothetical protein